MVAAQGLQGVFDRVFIDARAHSSLRDAAAFLGCPQIEFAHRDPTDLQKKIRVCSFARFDRGADGRNVCAGWRRRSTRRLSEACGSKATLWVDDAHAGGILGKRGKGSVELAGIGQRNVIQTVTFSKAFGAFGGAILCDNRIARRIVSQSSALAGSTPLPLPLVGAVLAALKIHRNEPRHREKLWRNVETFWSEIGLRPEVCVPIISVTASDSAALTRQLLKVGIYPCFIEYGGGPFSPTFVLRSRARTPGSK
jgi:7-keto-8-aminopelargonate synthetase-like enzyme